MNMPLRPAEREAITIQLEQLDTTLSDISFEEYQLNQRIASLHFQRRQIQYEKARILNTANSPCHALPNELLSQIFALAAGTSASIIAQQRVNIVAQVCHRFRIAAVATPSLWTYIDMAEGPPYKKSEVHIERSGACPLTVNIDLQERKFAYFEEIFICKILMPQVHRCRSFHLSVNQIEPMKAILPSFASNPAPYLEKFEVFYFGDDGDDFKWTQSEGSIETLAFGGKAPQLKSLTISGIHPPWNRFTIDGLLELGFDFHSSNISLSSRNFLDIISSSPLLERLTVMQGGSNLRLQAEDSNGNPTKSLPTIQLPFLRDLVHTFTETDLACDIFRAISTPNLRSLTMEYIKNDCAALLELMCGPPLLSRELSHLRLVGLSSIGAGRMLAFLRTVAVHVTTFHINAVNCPTLKEIPFLLRWMALERREYLLPKLEELISEGLTPRNLREMVQSRPTDQRPRKITMRRRDCVIKDDENMKWLRSNINLNLVEGSSDDEED